MSLKFTVPATMEALCRTPSIEFKHRGLEVSLGVTIDFDDQDRFSPLIDCFIDNKGVNLNQLLEPAAGGYDAMTPFCDHVRNGVPLDDRWYAAVEKGLDMFIDMIGIRAEPKDAPVRPATLELMTRLCSVAADLEGHHNYERGTLAEVHELLRTEPFDAREIFKVLKDGHEHAFRPGFTEDRPETWLIEACIRLILA